jgi:tetratricopeptide (TPR) repeat protein
MATPPAFSAEIWRLFRAEDYARARSLLQKALLDEPDSHWLLTRIGATLYEERRYDEALAYSKRAHAIAPRCPLVLWDLAGCHDMLGEAESAICIYERLIRRGVERVAYGDCGEGLRWARSLIADAHYRRGMCLLGEGRKRAARNAIDRHLSMRGPGCRSIYPLNEVRASRRALGT